MSKFLLIYVAAGIVFFALDFCWLAFATSRLYQSQLGELLLPRPNLQVAGLFYVLYVAGIVALAVLPNAENPWWAATLAGALLGLVAYGTYDVTNLATLRGWSLTVTLADLGWGTLLTAIAATSGRLVLSMV